MGDFVGGFEVLRFGSCLVEESGVVVVVVVV